MWADAKAGSYTARSLASSVLVVGCNLHPQLTRSWPEPSSRLSLPTLLPWSCPVSPLLGLPHPPACRCPPCSDKDPREPSPEFVWNSWLRQPLVELGLYDHCPALLQARRLLCCHVACCDARAVHSGCVM